jgi:hypothetical protein
VGLVKNFGCVRLVVWRAWRNVKYLDLTVFFPLACSTPAGRKTRRHNRGHAVRARARDARIARRWHSCRPPLVRFRSRLRNRKERRGISDPFKNLSPQRTLRPRRKLIRKARCGEPTLLSHLSFFIGSLRQIQRGDIDVKVGVTKPQRGKSKKVRRIFNRSK